MNTKCFRKYFGIKDKIQRKDKIWRKQRQSKRKKKAKIFLSKRGFKNQEHTEKKNLLELKTIATDV